MQGEQHASDQSEAKAHPPKPPMRNKHKDRQGRYALDTRKTLPDFSSLKEAVAQLYPWVVFDFDFHPLVSSMRGRSLIL